MDEKSIENLRDVSVDNEIKIFDQVKLMTLNTLGSGIFGKSFSHKEFEGIKPMDSFTHIMAGLSNELAVAFPWTCYLPTKANKDLSASILHFRKYLENMIEEERANYDPNVESHSLISLLIKADLLNTMSKAALVDNAVMFFSGGHETSTVTLALTIYLIGKHPEVQEKLRNEIDDFLSQGPPDYERLKKLKYLYSVIKECLRMYPPISLLVPRSATKDVVIGDIMAPKGTTFQINAYKIHHDSRFYESPFDFVPERWTNKEMKKKVPKGAFLGFAEGPRTCIGKNFSEIELAIYIVRLMEKFTIHVPYNSQVKFLRDTLLLIPNGDLKVILKPREY